MSDQAWALIIGAATVIALRVLDFVIPKGWVSKWTFRHGRRVDDDDEAEDAQ